MTTTAARRTLCLVCTLLAGCAPGPASTVKVPVQYGGIPRYLEPPVRANDAAPQIVAVWFSTRTPHWGEVMRVRVTTSTNAAIVEMHRFGYGRALHKRTYGIFSAVDHVPLLPPFLHPSYTMEVRLTARNSAGKSTSTLATLLVR